MVTNKSCILRLSKYQNAIYRLKNLGLVKVFSDNLADATGITSAQVRKDFSLFCISGNKRGGYLIDNLIEKLNQILGKDKIQKVIIVGAGNIGTALMNYPGFEKEGIKIVAGFDIDPHRHKKEAVIPVLPMDELKKFVKKNDIKLGIIAVPDTVAQEALNLMISSGIKGVLNFAPIRIKSLDDCIINNVNLILELESVIYFVNALVKEQGVI